MAQTAVTTCSLLASFLFFDFLLPHRKTQIVNRLQSWDHCQPHLFMFSLLFALLHLFRNYSLVNLHNCTFANIFKFAVLHFCIFACFPLWKISHLHLCLFTITHVCIFAKFHSRTFALLHAWLIYGGRGGQDDGGKKMSKKCKK